MALGVGGEVKYAEKTGERGTDSGVEDERAARSLQPLTLVSGDSCDAGCLCGP